ncbi:MAG: outer membrane protein assembly factor BamA [candidate division WOR-3 bacterium]|nr:outer membrane protein assembly factor BamA [candidate division WOR-3 bacterium]MCX7756916.1 outer membrane protein assembly factor BamA [candidate division WOR-3 bacterium]MDW7987656.1 outer membrane protein assembly factor BamA [candidate division WOR-3 bacterium]
MIANYLILFLIYYSQIIIGIDTDARFTDSQFIIQASGLNIGSVYSQYDIAQAIKRLYSLRLFETIDIETTQVADGVKIHFRVKEFPIVKDVKFFGNRKIKTKEILDKTKIKIGDVATNDKLFEWKLSIQDLYKEKGFLLVNINVERTEPDSTNKTILIFQIDEGSKVVIKKISFFGNTAISANKLKRSMSNKEKNWYRKGYFNEENFKEDLEKIIDIYRENGFLDAKIVNYDLLLDSLYTKSPGLQINIYLNEGSRYYIGKINFEGDSIIPRKNLESVLRIKSGQVYNAIKVNQSLSELYNLYSEEGYIYAQIAPQENIRNDTIDIKYNILENRPARIRLVIIEGNERTHDKVIRRQITTLPGSVFKRSEVIRSQRNIFNLGYFQDIKLDYRRADDEGNIDLIYQVKEKSSFGTIGAGVSYSAQDKLTGYIELTQPNFMGRGQQLSLKLEKGGKKTNVEFSFTEPYLFDMPLTWGFDLSYLTRVYDYYDKEEKSVGMSFALPFFLDYTKIYSSLRVSDAYVPASSIRSNYQPTGPYNIYRDTIHKTTFTPMLNFVRDSRDYIYNPLSGSLLSYSIELSTIDILYHRQIFDGSIYLPFLKKFCIMLRMRLGLIEGLTNRDTVPIYERFYAGGTGLDGIRGYPDRSLGVYEGRYNIGGKVINLYSLEYRFRPSPQLAFLAFYDAGNTWNSIKELNLSNLKRGAGIGVRLEIPMLGLIGFDLGYGFDRDGKGKWEPHLQIGRTF